MPSPREKLGALARQAREQVLEHTLQLVVRTLNEGFEEDLPPGAPEARENLLQLVRAWQDAQMAPPNEFEKSVGAPVPKILKMKFPQGCPNFIEIQKRCEPLLAAEGTGARPLVIYSGKASSTWTAWDHACNLDRK